MLIASLAFIGYAVVFLLRNFSGSGFELGVETLNGVTRANLNAINPAIVHYIGHLHVATAGFIAATGIAVAALSWYGVRRGEWWAWIAASFHRWSGWSSPFRITTRAPLDLTGSPTGPDLRCNCHLCRRRSAGPASHDAKSLLDTGNKSPGSRRDFLQKTQARESD